MLKHVSLSLRDIMEEDERPKSNLLHTRQMAVCAGTERVALTFNYIGGEDLPCAVLTPESHSISLLTRGAVSRAAGWTPDGKLVSAESKNGGGGTCLAVYRVSEESDDQLPEELSRIDVGRDLASRLFMHEKRGLLVLETKARGHTAYHTQRFHVEDNRAILDGGPTALGGGIYQGGYDGNVLWASRDDIQNGTAGMVEPIAFSDVANEDSLEPIKINDPFCAVAAARRNGERHLFVGTSAGVVSRYPGPRVVFQIPSNVPQHDRSIGHMSVHEDAGRLALADRRTVRVLDLTSANGGGEFRVIFEHPFSKGGLSLAGGLEWLPDARLVVATNRDVFIFDADHA